MNACRVLFSWLPCNLAVCYFITDESGIQQKVRSLLHIFGTQFECRTAPVPSVLQMQDVVEHTFLVHLVRPHMMPAHLLHHNGEGFLRVGCRPFPTSPRSFGKGLQFTPVSVVIVGCDIQPVFRNIITQVCQIKNMFRLYTASQYLQILIVARGKRRVYCS